MKTGTLYITDLDGTLLNGDSCVSEKSAEIISDLSRDGARITVATARTAATVVPLLRNTFTTPPAIVITGAALWNRKKEVYENLRFIENEVYNRIIDVLANYEIDPFKYFMDQDNRHLKVFHGYEMNRQENAFYQPRRNLQLKSFVLGQQPKAEMIGRCMLVFGTGETKKVIAAADELAATGLCSVSAYPDIFDSSASLIEVFAQGVNKADAVLRLKKETGAERLVVFGDNLNDISMMRVADLAVAVGNAFPEVKKIADVVIEVNNADAVARFIREDFYNR